MTSANLLGRGEMQKIDAGYLYELGALLRPLRNLGYGEMNRPWFAWSVLVTARDSIRAFTDASIYASGLRTAKMYGDKLGEELQALITRIEDNEWNQQTDEFKPQDVLPSIKAFGSFEPIIIAEMQAASIFYVPPRGAFDNAHLIDSGERLFPEGTTLKAPETLADIKQGARCIAFDLPTAAGFHFHRANEAVLRRYYDSVANGVARPKNSTMGTLIAAMKDKGFGDKNVIAALDNIKEFHRNPLMHPEHTLANVEEAIDLYCAIRAAMGYMLEKLPIDFNAMMETSTPNTLFAAAASIADEAS